MPEVSARGIRFHVQTMDPPETSGRTPVVVFIHGLLMDNLSSYYYTLAGPVARAGARAVMYDLRGHGRSARPATGYSITDAVADLFEILRVLGHERPVHLVANSFGGLIALRAALARPEQVAGLVLIDAHGPAERPAEWREELLNKVNRAALVLEYDRLADQLLAAGRRRPGREAATVHAMVNGTSLLADLAAAEPLGAADLATVTCPVLAVYGASSDMIEAGRTLGRHVPHCRLHELPGLAHTVLLDATGELRDLLLAWLADHAHTKIPAGAKAR
jgi:pimeloyl-ACP methyl ester carboxylesterase